MKKFVNYGISLMLIASPFLLTSCGEDPENTNPSEPDANAPTLSIADAEDEDKTTIEIGQEVTFTVNVTAPGILNAFVVNKTVDGGNTEEVERIPKDAGTSPTTYEYNFSFTADEDDADKKIIFNFVAIDDNVNEGQTTYIINVSKQDAGDDPILDAPSFEVTGVEVGEEATTTANVGEAVNFNLNVNAPGGFKRLLIEKTIGAIGTPQAFEDILRPGAVIDEYTYEFSYTPTAEEAGETIYFDFLAVDESNLDNTYEYVINVETQQVEEYHAVLFYAPIQDQTNEVWFSSSLGEIYSTADVNATSENISTEIDFGYRYGPSAGATLASPAQYPIEGGQNIEDWSFRRETMLRRTDLSPSEFLEQGGSGQFIVDAFEEGTEGENAQILNGLQEGEVLAFMTDPDKAGGSQYGLIHVREIDLGSDGTGYGSDAFISIDVKVTE